jgi:hypothetical protein
MDILYSKFDATGGERGLMLVGKRDESIILPRGDAFAGVPMCYIVSDDES